MNRWRWWLGALVVLAALAVAAIWHYIIWQRFIWFTGSRNEPGPLYGFWSGFGGSWLPGYLGLGLLFYWHSQCHVSGCYWYARRITAAGERACWKHHPHAKRTAEDVHAAHHAALRAREHSQRPE